MKSTYAYLRSHLNRLFLFTVILLLLGITARVSWTMLAGGPWPMFRQNEQHTGLSASLGPQSAPTVLWSYLAIGGIHSSPTVGPDGSIYFGSLGGYVYALNANGTEKWPPYNTNGAGFGREIWSSPALHADGSLLIGVNDAENGIDHKLLSLNATTGSLNWEVLTTDPVLSSPVIDSDGNIFIGTGPIGVGTGEIMGISPAGEVDWSVSVDGPVLSSPALNDAGEVVVAYHEIVLGLAIIDVLNPANGASTFGGLSLGMAASTISSSPAIDLLTDNLYIGNNAGIHVVTNISTAPAQPVSSPVALPNGSGGMDTTSPALSPTGDVIIGQSNGDLTSYPPGLGAFNWTVTPQGQIAFASPAVGADGKIYLPTSVGIEAFDTAGNPLWQETSINSIFISSPALYNGVLYVGTDAGNLVALADSANDTDGDGLSNHGEGVLGTNPVLADTDTDGVDDGFDAFPSDINTAADTDGIAHTVPAGVIGADQHQPAVWEDRVVYEDYRNGTAEIWLYDFATGTETQIAAGATPQLLPEIDGNRIVWSARPNPGEAFDIFLYDLGNPGAVNLTLTNETTLGQENPAIHGKYVVYVDYSSESAQITLLDLDTLTTTPVTIAADQPGRPEVNGDYVTWHAGTPGDRNVFAYHIPTATTTQLTNTTFDQAHAQIWNGHVVWHDNRNGNFDIYMHDLATSTETRITTNTSAQTDPHLFGDYIYYKDTRNSGTSGIDLFRYQLSTATETPFIVAPNDQVGIAVGRNRVAWQDPFGGGSNAYFHAADGVADSVDSCPNAFNLSQSDIDADGIGDACDPSTALYVTFEGQTPGAYPDGTTEFPPGPPANDQIQVLLAPAATVAIRAETGLDRAIAFDDNLDSDNVVSAIHAMADTSVGASSSGTMIFEWTATTDANSEGETDLYTPLGRVTDITLNESGTGTGNIYYSANGLGLNPTGVTYVPGQFVTVRVVADMQALTFNLSIDGASIVSSVPFVFVTDPGAVRQTHIARAGGFYVISEMAISLEQDSDGDGVADSVDAFPGDPTESVDTDGDGTGNNADTDDDNDGIDDVSDAFPLDPTESVDTDGDGTGNNADLDDDNDGILDTEEIVNGTNPLNPDLVSLASTTDPMFRQNPLHPGLSLNLGPLSFPTSGAGSYATGGTVYSSAAIDTDGTRYVGNNNGAVFAINPDGTLKWSTTVGEEIWSSALLDDANNLYIGVANPTAGGGRLVKLDTATGVEDPVWAASADTQFTDPVYASASTDASGNLYIASGSNDGSSGGELLKISPAGVEQWRLGLPRGSMGVNSSVAINAAGNPVVVFVDLTGGQTILAVLDAATGIATFSVDLGASTENTSTGYAKTPVIDAATDAVYVAAAGKMHYLPNISTAPNAANLVSVTVPGVSVGSSLTVPALGPNGDVYVSSSSPKQLVSYAPGLTAQNWVVPKNNVGSSPPVVGSNGFIYLASSVLEAFDDTGILRWIGNIPYTPLSAPVIGSDRVIYLGTSNGFLAAKAAPDTDGDGQRDDVDNDDDNDGTIDLVELANGTDPLVADTDGDTVNDTVDALALFAGESLDGDNDGLGDSLDNCPVDATPRTWRDGQIVSSPKRRHATVTDLGDGRHMTFGGVDDFAFATLSYLNSGIVRNRLTGTSQTFTCGTRGRALHTATLLPNGKVLIAGGWYEDQIEQISESLADAWLYDPAGNTCAALPDMASTRSQHTATLLPNGNVLIAGGWATPAGGPNGPTNTAEFFSYGPATFTTINDTLAAARNTHTATLMADGRVLIAGGFGAAGALSSAEIYVPFSTSSGDSNGVFTSAATMNSARGAHRALLLQNGTVFVTGGNNGDSEALASTEIFTPNGAGAFSAGPNMAGARQWHAMTLLPNDSGQVLVAGGNNSTNPHWSIQSNYLSTAELMDSGVFSAAPALNTARSMAGFAPLSTGEVIMVGGFIGDPSLIADSEFFEADQADTNENGIGDACDLSGPVITVADITLPATEAGGTPVTDVGVQGWLANVTATDVEDGPVPVTNDLTLTLLPVGITAVTFSASDSDENTTMVSANITIEFTDTGGPGGVPDGIDDNVQDSDEDGIVDLEDNCPDAANTDQSDVAGGIAGDACEDTDEDGVLDIADPCPSEEINDVDGDGYCVGRGFFASLDATLDGDNDNCPGVANDQADEDTDGIGDACDDVGGAPPACKKNCDPADSPATQDDDFDGLSNDAEIALGTDPNNEDTDGDGVNDGFDNCPLPGLVNQNLDQLDTDDDGAGDACDNDDDGDSVVDTADNCPLLANLDQTNTDTVLTETGVVSDGDGDACDADIDGDGSDNSNELVIGSDVLDPDTDDDGVLDGADATPLGNAPQVEFRLLDGATDVTASWRPLGGSAVDSSGGTVTVQVILKNSSGVDQVIDSATMALGTSRHPGVATNDVETCASGICANDFSFAATLGTNTQAGAVSAGRATVDLYSFDYGGQATISATVTGTVDGAPVTLTASRTFPVDTDGDRLPDFFETAHGFNPIDEFSIGTDVDDGEQDVDTSASNTNIGDGLTNFEEYRGIVKDVDDCVGATRTHEETDPGSKDLFVRGVGYANSCNPPAVANLQNFDINWTGGSAYEEVGITVHDVTRRPSFEGTTEPPNIDIVVVENNTTDSETIDSTGNGYINHCGALCYTWERKGDSYYGDASDYQVLRDTNTGAIIRRGTFTYHLNLMHYVYNRPYLEIPFHAGYEQVLDTFDLNEDTIIENGTGPDRSRGQSEDRNGNESQDGDLYQSDWKTAGARYGTMEAYEAGDNYSVFDQDGDGLVELPLLNDANGLNPAAQDPGEVDSIQRVQTHTLLHEIGHAIGIRHTTEAGDLMRDVSTDWNRGGHFSAAAAGQILINNKTE